MIIPNAKGTVGLILTAIMLSVPTFSKSNHIKSLGFTSGTLVIAAIGSDGIILAADSRTNFGPDPKNVIGYFDSTEKIIQFKHYGVAISGTATTGKSDLMEELKKFEPLIIEGAKLDKIITDFYNFLLQEISSEDLEEYMDTMLIFAGYENGAAVLKATMITQNHNNAVVLTRHDTLFSSIGVQPFFNYRLGIPCIKLCEMADKAIAKYSVSKKFQRTIGGPVSVLYIPFDRPTMWLQNNFTSHILFQKDIIARYKEHKMRIHFLTKDAKRKTDSIVYGGQYVPGRYK